MKKAPADRSLCHGRFQQSVEAPMAVLRPAGGAIARQFPAIAVGGLDKVAADHTAAAVFARRLEVAARIAVVPVIAATEIAVQAIRIGPEGVRLVVAIDISCDRVSEQPAQ